MKLVFSKVPFYTPLLGIYALTVLVFVSFPMDRPFQRAAIIAAALAHVTWGIIYHYIHKDLSAVLVLEYVAIAALGVASILSIL